MQKTQAPNSFNKRVLIALGLLLFMVAGAAVYLCLLRSPSVHAADYPVQGFDVSHHQQEIQWQQISPEKYRFVYLKATEGGDYKDSRFQENWIKAREQGFLVGAYHFYRLCRDGSIQTQNFIASVPNKADALPPVIDLEYDSRCINTYSKQQLVAEIQRMHDALKIHYGKQPIFYTSKSFYNIVLAGSFPGTPLWVREYKGLPDLKDQPDWIFWQHTNAGKIPGISTPVDLNVFYGSEQHWLDFLQKNGITTPPRRELIK